MDAVSAMDIYEIFKFNSVSHLSSFPTPGSPRKAQDLKYLHSPFTTRGWMLVVGGPQTSHCTLTFLSDFPAHSGFQSRQMFLLRLGETVRDGEGGVVEWVGTFRVPVTPTLPTFYGITCMTNVGLPCVPCTNNQPVITPYMRATRTAR